MAAGGDASGRHEVLADEQRAPPARPWVALAAALAAGDFAGGWLGPGLGHWSAWWFAPAASALALLGIAALQARAHHARLARLATANAWPATGSVPAAVLVALALCGALRAGVATARLLPVSTGRTLARSADANPTWVGRWRLVRLTERRAIGRLEPLEVPAAQAFPAADGRHARTTPLGASIRVEVPLGALEDGALLAFPDGVERRRYARGPRDADERVRGSPDRFVLQLDEIRRIAPPRESGITGRIARTTATWRRAIIDRLDRLPFASDDARALALALLVGETSRLDSEIADRFTRTGTRHVLAISGLHVGLVAGLIVLPVARVAAALGARIGRRRPAPALGARNRRERLVPFAAAACVALVAALAGGRAPVARAALATGLALLTPWIAPRRRPDALTLWSVALACECLGNPLATHQVGVQLSYAATLAILVACRPLSRACAVRIGTPDDAWLRATTWRRALSARAARFACTALAASVVATVATLAIVWPRFGECAPIGIVATPLVVPLVAWCLVTGWAALAGLAPCSAFEAGHAGCLALLALADRLPWTPLALPPRPALLVSLAAVALVRGFTGSPRALRVGLALFGVAFLPWTARPAGVELVAFEVGHGTAVLVDSPGDTWIFDAGSRDRLGLARTVSNELAAREVARPAYFVSHDDRDHVSALGWLAERHPPRLWVGAELPTVPRWRRARGSEPWSADDETRTLPSAASRAHRIDVAAGRVQLPARGPAQFALVRGAPLAGNEGSRALSVGGVDAAGRLVWAHLTGDAEDAGLAPLIDRHDLPGPTRLLLYPHHGADGPLTGRLCAELDPAEVWISSSDPGGVAAELERRGLIWRSTGVDGPLSLQLLDP